MTSVLNVDTIADKAGTGPVALTKQSPAKAWAECNSAGTSINDSFNIASLVDTDTGRQTCNYTNSFASGSYACVTTGDSVGSNMVFSATNASNWIVYSFNGSSYSDMGMGTIAAGDLA